MPILSVHRLRFHGGLHLGVRGVNLEESSVTVPSDTLFAALTDGWRRLGGNVDAWLAPFRTDPPDPPFLLTSAFPVVGGVRFYPMPVAPQRLFAERQAGKRVKRIRFLSESLLKRALKGELLDAWLPPEDAPPGAHKTASAGLFLHHGALWLDMAAELDRLPGWMRFVEETRGKRPVGAYPRLDLWQERRTPRVTVDRIASASTIFHIGHVRFAAECGLWFGVHWRAPERRVGDAATTYAESVAAALDYLQGEGLGGDRSVGYGAFTFDDGREQTTLPDSQPGQIGWLLSRYHPRREGAALTALQASGGAHRITNVAGWLRSPDGPAQRRKRIHLLEEGSWISVSGAVLGDLMDVTPDYENPDGALPHRVYRAGFGLTVGRLPAASPKEEEMYG